MGGWVGVQSCIAREPPRSECLLVHAQSAGCSAQLMPDDIVYRHADVMASRNYRYGVTAKPSPAIPPAVLSSLTGPFGAPWQPYLSPVTLLVGFYIPPQPTSPC